MTRSIALLPLLALVACAHAKPPPPIVITSHVLDGAGMTFESVAAGMVSASQRGALSRDQVIAWNDFTVRWAAGYGLAVTKWVEAKQKLDQPAAQQATALLSGLLADLAVFQFIAQGAAP